MGPNGTKQGGEQKKLFLTLYPNFTALLSFNIKIYESGIGQNAVIAMILQIWKKRIILDFRSHIFNGNKNM